MLERVSVLGWLGCRDDYGGERVRFAGRDLFKEKCGAPGLRDLAYGTEKSAILPNVR